MSARAPLALYSLLFFSGGAGLAYQSIWTKTFTLALGHEMPSLLGVVGAFFAGLSAGSWSLGQRIGRSERPHRWYAGCELVIAFAALLTPIALPLASQLAGQWLGAAPPPVLHWTMAFVIPFVVLLPATFSMGATLPAMEQVLARRALHGRVVGGAYAANTAGAVAGILISVFVALPLLGQSRTLALFAAVNVLCALGAMALGSRSAARPAADPDAKPLVRRGPPILAMLLFTGLLGVGYEVLAVRVLSQVFEATLYSFATALAVYLAASSLGAALTQRLISHQADVAERWLSPVLAALAMSCVLGLSVMFGVETIYRAMRLALGDRVVDVFLCELTLAFSVFALPSFLMGTSFAMLAQLERARRGHIGPAMAINTLGAALAPGLFGIALLPAVGAKWSIGVVAVGYLALSVVARPPTARRAFGATAAIAGAVLCIAALPSLQITTLREGERVVHHREGVMATSAVVVRGGAKNLRVNNRYQMGGTSVGALLFQRRQAHIPLLMHPSPDTALFLGVASGVTVGTAAEHRAVDIDAVELVPEVLSLLPHFAPANGAPHTRANVSLYASDARRFVQFADRQYDVIVADLYHPARDGAGLLFSKEHYAAISDRLSSDGVFCHWLPFHQLDLDMIRLIARTYLDVFPDGQLVLASDMLRFPALGLITGLDTANIGPGYLKARVPEPALRAVLQRDRLTNELQLLSTVLLDTEALTELAGDGPLNTDDLPLLSYHAPRFSYDRGSKPYGRLLAILDQSEPSALRMTDRRAQSASFLVRWRKFVKARNLYLTALQVHMERGAREAVPFYLTSARASSDFHTSFSQLFKLASEWRNSSPDDALSIATALKALRPDVKPVDDLLGEMSGRPPTGDRP